MQPFDSPGDPPARLQSPRDQHDRCVRRLQRDPTRDNDVALLRVEGFITSSLPVRPTTELRKGDDVIALGYPLVSIQGQEQKATFGRVNALSGATGDDRFLQIDAPIQPGNSGGPLLDAHGNVIGIVTATLNQLETFRAAGVAFPRTSTTRCGRASSSTCWAMGEDPGSHRARRFERTRPPASIVDRSEVSVYLVIARSAAH